MMKMKTSGFSQMLLLLLGAVLVLGACKKDPVACYNPNRQAIIPGKFVTFFNCSANATSYKWDFGDGNTSTEESPFNGFAAKGTYDVTLEAMNDKGDVNTVSQEIFVGDPAPLQIVVDTVDFPPNAASSLLVELDGEELISTTVTPLDVPFSVITSLDKIWTGNTATLRIKTTLDDFTVTFDPQNDSNSDMLVQLRHPPFWSAYVVLTGR